MRTRGDRPSRPFGGKTARLAVICALSLGLALACPASATTITIATERNGDTIDIRASAILNADGATAWHVLTDYNRYPEFIPELHSSRVVARRGATVAVEQSGAAAIWRFKMPLEITFDITEFPPSSLRSRATAGSLRALTSGYTLTPMPPGIRLDYVGHVTPGFEIFGYIEQTTVEHNVARQFQALADEIERQGEATRTLPVAGAR